MIPWMYACSSPNELIMISFFFFIIYSHGTQETDLPFWNGAELEKGEQNACEKTQELNKINVALWQKRFCLMPTFLTYILFCSTKFLRQPLFPTVLLTGRWLSTPCHFQSCWGQQRLNKYFLFQMQFFSAYMTFNFHITCLKNWV